MSYSTIAIIYNPNSTGSSERLAKAFAKKLQAKLPTQKIELLGTTHARHAEELAHSIATASKNPLIISSSGDGGYNEIINGALKARKRGHSITVGLLPAGNANDHYHTVHESDTIDLIVHNKTKKVDVLKIKSTADGKKIERYAHSYIGFGLTPEVATELYKTKLNIFNEVWLVARGLFIVKPVRLKIGRKVRYYESVVFSNIDTMSKYLKISQPSSITDGKFEVTIFRRRSKLKLILLLLQTSIQPAKEDRKASKFVIDTVDKTLVQLDGEIVTLDGRARTVITVEKRALTCII